MIFLEYYPDKALIKAIGIPKKEIVHAFSKGNVCKKLEKVKRCWGLVDKDPSSAQPTYMARLKSHTNEGNIELLYDEQNKNYLIVLYPELEDWILESAKEVEVNPTNFGLPNGSNELKKVVNNRLRQFENLIHDIIRKKGKRIITLEGFLKGKI